MEKQEIRTFGRRHGKKLSSRQQWLVEYLLPKLVPNPKSPVPIVLEIGFGAGEHLRQLALEHPNDIVIGAEPFMNGVASLLSHIVRQQECGVWSVECGVELIKPEYKNIRIWPDDVRKLLNPKSQVPSPQNPSFKEIWILHPDPWPKARHGKRRLLNADFLNLLSAHLANGGQIIIGTDHHEYYDWIVEQVKKTNLQIMNTNHEHEIIKTRYQEKNKAGTSAPKYLVLSN